MKSFDITIKALQVRLQRNNTIAIRRTLCYAAVVLGIVALLIGCPDDMADDNGTPTEATQVQSATSDATAISANSITLNWTLPTDTDGYLGVTISEESNAGSLGDAVELDDSTTEYQVTNLEAATEYTFTIATRYTASGKNNSTTVTVTTLGVPTEATLVQNATSAATTDTITLNWTLPTDTDGYLGVTISERERERERESNSGSLSAAVELDDDVTEYQVTGLEAGTEYSFIIATRYTDSGKNNSTTITAMTAVATEVQGVALDAAETTSDSATITWEDPVDTTGGYTGIMISVTSSVDGFMATETVPNADTDTVTISGLKAGTLHTLMLTFVTQYDTAGKGSSSDHTIPVTTQSNIVTGVMGSDTGTTVTLSWTDPEDRVRYSGVMVTGSTTAGDMIVPQTINATAGSTAEELIIADLTGPTDYTFTITTQYENDTAGNSKSGGSSMPFMIRTRNPIDLDGDTLVDINSLERLDNVRHNLNLGAASDDGRYKNSTQTANNAGVLCGDNGATSCTGYELTRSLDFNDGSSYESGSSKNTWRPNTESDSTGMVLAQSDADSATNGGWTPIGGSFASRFEGNGHTIHNLYSRNHTHVGLFSATTSAAVIRSIGMATAYVYGRANESSGALVGMHNGIIVASYASGGTVTGASGERDRVGGLVGHNEGTIVASYANGTVAAGNGTLPDTGGLVGRNTSRIIASYANSNVKGGTITSNDVGGLVGSNLKGSGSAGNIIASYATGTVNGGAGSIGNTGGLVGSSTLGSSISASYADSSVNGGAGHSDRGGTLVGERLNNPAITASYGFGTLSAEIRDSSGEPPSGATTSAALIAPDPDDRTNAAVDAVWNDADHLTLDAWDFGNSSQAPALRYADYDGPTGNIYACGGTALTPAATIPDIVATPTGPMTITCGSTLLPDQEGR